MRERDHELGLHGLALLRATDEHEVAVHRDAIAQLVAADDGTGAPRRLPEVGSREGYATWAQTYDGQGNRSVRAEDPVMTALLDELGPGAGRRAVDAGCGTGRHTTKLVARGWETVGVDGSPEMLEVAREQVPGADLREGDLRELPVEDGWADLAVCALALSHLPDLGAMAELGRVLRPGGVLLLSNPHPVATGLLGARAWCRTPVGGLVDGPHLADRARRRGGQGVPVDPDGLLARDVPGGIRDDPAVDLHAPGGDDGLRPPPGRHAGVGEVLGQPHGALTRPSPPARR